MKFVRVFGKVKVFGNRFLLALCVVGLAMIPFAYALNTVWSNTVREGVQVYTLVLATNNTSPYVGDSVLFSCVVRLNGVAVGSGVNVTFHKDNVVQGYGLTNSSGVAVWSWLADVSSDWNCSAW